LGVLTRETVSMQSIRAWLKANPSAARQVMETNQSYVFFKEAPVGNASLGSDGTEGVALTPEASIAVDTNFHALGVPIFVVAQLPDGHVLQNLFIAQDTGGAIRGPARADVFFGFGARAEALAGAMKSSGQLFVLLPKQVAQGVGR
jgi:membrane-bound lytic murein transglycosylase A